MLEFGLDENFKLEFIDSADSTQHKYFCPECRSLLTVKNRDFEGRIKVKHFAHNYGRSCCMAGSDGESFLHVNTKLLLYKKLTENKKFPVYLKVRVGENIQHVEIDLLDGVDKIELEKKVLEGGIIPDISLYKGGILAKVIEVVVTHEDSRTKTIFYAVNGIKVFRVQVNDRVYKSLKRGSLPIFTIGKQSLSNMLKY